MSRPAASGAGISTSAASPASDVSLRVRFMLGAVVAIAAIVVSKSTRWRVSVPSLAMQNAAKALTEANAQRSMQGTWTKPPTGSHAGPR